MDKSVFQNFPAAYDSPSLSAKMSFQSLFNSPGLFSSHFCVIFLITHTQTNSFSFPEMLLLLLHQEEPYVSIITFVIVCCTIIHSCHKQHCNLHHLKHFEILQISQETSIVVMTKSKTSWR